MMKREEREAWLLEYCRVRSTPHAPYSLNVLDSYLVDQFVEATGAKATFMVIGADKCRLLSRDLARMYRDGKLTRNPAGIHALSGMGFPKWVWDYRIATLMDHG